MNVAAPGIKRAESGTTSFSRFRSSLIAGAVSANDAQLVRTLDSLGPFATISPNQTAIAVRILRTYFLLRYADRLGTDLSAMLKFQTLGRIDTTNWYLPEFIRQRDWLRQRTAELGLAFKSYDGRMEEVTASGGDSIIAILTHSDVVDVEGQSWRYPAWEGRVVGDTVFGRGAMDEKGPIIPALYALAAIHDTQWRLPSTLKLLVSNGEETDWSEIQYYQERALMPQYTIGMDGTFPVTNGQKGVGLITLKSDSIAAPTRTGSWTITSLAGGSWVGTIPEEAKANLLTSTPIKTEVLRKMAVAWCVTHAPARMDISNAGDTIVVSAHGKGGHAAIPQNGHNALGDLTAFLGTLDLTMNQWGALTKFVGMHIGTETNGTSLGIAHSDSEMGDLTINLGVMRLDAGVPTAFINPRVPKGISSSQIDSIVWARADAFNSQYNANIQTRARSGEPHFVPADSKLVSTLLNSWQEVTGTERKPHVTGGGLQSRLFPGGVDFGPAMSIEEDRSHQSNEFMTINELKMIGELTISALINLLALPH